jgi:RluA family pseudouridine synthase
MANKGKTHIRRVIAGEETRDKPSRVVDYLNARLDDFSRSGIKKMVVAGLITINDSQAQTSDWIQTGDVIDVYKNTEVKEVWKIPLNVRFEDDEIAIVHKPAGIPTSGYGKHTLTGALPFNIMLNSSSRGILPHPVHRLDRDTEGLVLIAKTRKSASNLAEMLAQGAIKKTYRAWVHGTADMDSNIVWKIPISDKESITHGKVRSVDTDKNLSLLELHPITGRTHQLRIHCAENNLPIVGDNKYGIDKGMRLKLMAYSLCFTHPMCDKLINVRISDKHAKRFNKIILI